MSKGRAQATEHTARVSRPSSPEEPFLSSLGLRQELGPRAVAREFHWKFLACGHFQGIWTTILPLGISPKWHLWPKPRALQFALALAEELRITARSSFQSASFLSLWPEAPAAHGCSLCSGVRASLTLSEPSRRLSRRAGTVGSRCSSVAIVACCH